MPFRCRVLETAVNGNGQWNDRPRLIATETQRTLTSLCFGAQKASL